MKKLLLMGALICGLALTACETVPEKPDTDPGGTGTAPVTEPVTDPSVEPAPQPAPVTNPPAGSGVIIAPPTTPQEPYQPPVNTTEISGAYQSVPGWGQADFTNALISFQRGCSRILDKNPGEQLHARREFGMAGDWYAPCAVAGATPVLNSATSRAFFESEFLPVDVSAGLTPEGMITGYYQPEIQARRVKDAVYSEPILTEPSSANVLTLPRSQINETTSTVIAYGRPIDVFFMQVQGSGVLVFPDGMRVRAAYDANNGRPYTSIGRILVERGAFTLEQASKQRIEDWMAQNGPAATRELMNQNTRYIFFKEETILPGEGPKGAMRVPLTDMASIAVDPSHYPYGLPVWLDVKLPAYPGDYRGTERQFLVVSQDTGKAIRGPYRADLYFGSGDYAGQLAGVMKHTGRWTVLLPFGLAIRYQPVN